MYEDIQPQIERHGNTFKVTLNDRDMARLKDKYTITQSNSTKQLYDLFSNFKYNNSMEKRERQQEQLYTAGAAGAVIDEPENVKKLYDLCRKIVR